MNNFRIILVVINLLTCDAFQSINDFKSEDSPTLEDSSIFLFTNQVNPNTMFFVDKRNYENPSVKNLPDMSILFRILDQAKSSHKI